MYSMQDYNCSGKKYSGERAVISLTSWRARIGTVSKTLFSLLKMCPDFHIVLVLSEEEFPKKEAELPESLMLFVENELIELLWVYKNYKAFKKVLFTMDKYRDIPVISADDDCVYLCNYAEILYKEHLKNPNARISFEKVKRKFGQELLCGYGTINPPNCFNKLKDLEKILNDLISLNLTEDDMLYALLSNKFNIKMIGLGYHGHDKICVFHDDNNALSEARDYGYNSDYYKIVKILLQI